MPEKTLASHPQHTLRVALDTTYAGVNKTGVGIYSRRLASYLALQARHEYLKLRCYGPACIEESRKPERVAGMFNIAQEWPANTHVMLPLRLLSFRPDIVHATSHIGPLLGPGRLVVTVHDLIFMQRPEDYNPLWLAVTQASLPRVFARAAAIIADSQATSRDVERYFNIDPARLHVVYPGIDPSPPIRPDSKQDATLATIGLGPTERYIILLGPWVQRKNLSVVVEAFGRIAEHEPGLRLIITGTQAAGMKGTAPSETVAQLPGQIQSRVHLVGFLEREPLYRLIRAAALLAYPSRIEGFGLPPLEAMSLGVPVVASDTPVLLEVAGGAALHAPVGEVEAWAKAFSRVLNERGLAERLREAGFARSKMFSWDRCAEETISVYREVAGLRQRTSRES